MSRGHRFARVIKGWAIGYGEIVMKTLLRIRDCLAPPLAAIAIGVAVWAPHAVAQTPAPGPRDLPARTVPVPNTVSPQASAIPPIEGTASATREATMKKYDEQAATGAGQTAVISAGQYKTLAGQIKEWWAQRNRVQLIQQAEQLARADVAALTADHARLEPEAQAAEAKAAALKAAGESNSARVKDLENLAAQRNILSILDDRLAAQQQLVTLYDRWGNQVELQHKIMLHLILRSLSLIATIVLLTILAGWGLQAAFDRISRDRRQRQALRIILNLGAQVIDVDAGASAKFTGWSAIDIPFSAMNMRTRRELGDAVEW